MSRAKFYPKSLESVITKSIQQWDKGELYGSDYNGIDYSDPQQKAWSNFPWKDLKNTEKKFIVDTWNYYVSGKSWPASKISDEYRKKQTGKFLFFEQINLAPTLGEYYGYHKIETKKWQDFYAHNKFEFKINDKTKSYFTGNIINPNTSGKATFAGDSCQLSSVKLNTLSKNQYYEYVINNSKDIPYQDIRRPYEDVFKLSWMREFVQTGLEKRMGPFVADINEDGTPNRNPDNTIKIRVGNIDKLIEHQYDYKKAIFYQWVQSELDWVNNTDSRFNKNYNYDTDDSPKPPKEYLEALLTPHSGEYDAGQIGPELDLQEYRLKSDYYLKDGSPAFLNKFWYNLSTRKNTSDDISQGHIPFTHDVFNRADIDSRNYKLNYSDLFFVIGCHSGVIEGYDDDSPDTKKLFTNIVNFNNPANPNGLYTSGLPKSPDNIDPLQFLADKRTGKGQTPPLFPSEPDLFDAGSTFTKYTPMAIGIPPYYKNDTDRRKNIVSGWIVLPHLFGRLQLPWPFVWKYIGISGFFYGISKNEINGLVYNDYSGNDVVIYSNEFSNLYVPYNKPGTTAPRELWLEKNARTRFWHFRYGDRSYGKTSGQQSSILEPNSPFSNLMDFTVYNNNKPRVINDKTQTSIAYNYNDIKTRISLDWYAQEPEIPLRELFFYFRMKYGASKATGLRYVYNKAPNNQDYAGQIWAIHGGGVPNNPNVFKDLATDTFSRIFSKTFILHDENKDGGELKPSFENIETPTHLLRSKYVCILHDKIGWGRFVSQGVENEHYGNHQSPTLENIYYFSPQSSRALNEITNYVDKGYYSFNGGLTDRLPWINNGDEPNLVDDLLQQQNLIGTQTWFDSRNDIRISVDANHLSLGYLLNDLNTPETPSISDDSDRYISPNFPLSYGKTTDKQTKLQGKYKVELSKKKTKEQKLFDEKEQILFYNHALIPEYSVRDEFNPGLLTEKEIQFLYEMVTYNLYGGIPLDKTFIPKIIKDILGVDAWVYNRDSYWLYEFEDRWKELAKRINIPLYDTEKKWDFYNDTTIDLPIGKTIGGAIRIEYVSTLSDYILWAAPTYDQYNKKRFSDYSDGFVSKYKNEKYRNPEADWVYKKSEIPEVFESKWPFSALAEYIINSETSVRPLVPAFVHHRYISRKLNTVEKYDASGRDARGIQNELVGKVNRTMGGKQSSDSQDEGVLITLPTFVLGGRVDLGEGIDSWDTNWGKTCPFSMKEYVAKDGTKKSMLVVGDLDDVIDAWAKGKKYFDPSVSLGRGRPPVEAGTEQDISKYVSAMEIAFWIRYKHGMASAPADRRIENNLDESISNVWIPKNIKIKDSTTDKSMWRWPEVAVRTSINAPTSYRDWQNFLFTSAAPRAESFGGSSESVLYFESLHQVPLLTSYYNPIVVYNNDGICADPLIQISILRNGEPETNSFTGFNSKNACYWAGAKKVTDIRQISSLEALGGVGKGIAKFLGQHDSLSTKYSEDYLEVHNLYRSITRGPGGKKSDGSTSTGFDNELNVQDSYKIILASDIQSWFKAFKLIQTAYNYAEYIFNGLQLPEGAKNSVIEVEGTVIDAEEPDNREKDQVHHYYISGESVGSALTSYNKEQLISFEESMRIRPWNDRLEYAFESEQLDAVRSFSSDFDLGTTGCIPNKRYMRHILVPNLFMYYNDQPEKGWYSSIQVDTIKKTIQDVMLLWNIPPKNLSEIKNFSPFAKQYAALIKSPKWVKTFSKSTYESKYEKDVRRFNALDQFVNEYNKTAQKLNWNTFYLKTATTVLSVIGKISYYKIGDDTSAETKAFFEATNKAFKTNYTHWFESTKNFSKGVDFLKNKIIAPAKFIFDAFDAGLFGNERPKGLPSGIDSNTLYGIIWKKGKPFVNFAKGKLESEAASFVIHNVTDKIIEKAVTRAASRTITVAVESSVAVEATAAAGTLGTVIAIGGVYLFVTVVVAIIFYAIDRIIEDWENEEAIQEMWTLINKATSLGVLEGPYLQSSGSILIKKTINNEIKVLGSTYPPSYQKNYLLDKTEDFVGPTINPQEPLNLETMGSSNSKQLYKLIKEANDNFYGKGGTFETVIKNEIKKDSCECEFFYSLFGDGTTPAASINIKNREKSEWATGPFKRRLFDRENVVDEAPIYSDNPFMYTTAPSPDYDVPAWDYDVNSDQRGGAEVGVRTDRTRNVELSGIVVLEDGSERYCPRFWWPYTTINSATNLCDYIAKDGKYPKKQAQNLYGCEKGILGGGSGADVDRFNMFDATATEFMNATQNKAYSRIDKANSKDIKYFTVNQITPDRLSGKRLYVDRRLIMIDRNLSGRLNEREIRYHYVSNTKQSRKRKFENILGYGETIFTAEGVHGPAPPHEREIVNIFRKKYKIDIVIPGYWSTKAEILGDSSTQVGAQQYFHPLKEKFSDTLNFIPGGCCAMSEILITKDNDTEEGIPPTEAEINTLKEKKKRAVYCEYVISLNTEKFKNFIRKTCKKEEKKEETNTTNQISQYIASTLPTPKPETTADVFKIFTPPATNGRKDKKSSDLPFYLQPVLPGCTNCPADRPLVTTTGQNVLTTNNNSINLYPGIGTAFENRLNPIGIYPITRQTIDNTGAKQTQKQQIEDNKKKKDEKQKLNPKSGGGTKKDNQPSTPSGTGTSGTSGTAGTGQSSGVTQQGNDGVRAGGDEVKKGEGKQPVTVTDEAGTYTYVPSNCFTFSTTISTPNGLVQIQDIKLGDSVYAFDQSGNIVETEVSHHIKHNLDENSEVFRYILSNGITLDITENHGVLNQQNEFVQIGSLTLGDSLITQAGEFVQILSKESIGIHEVYNISTKNYGTYFANGIRVSGDWNPTKESW